MKNSVHRNAVAALPVMGVGMVLSLVALAGPSGAWASAAWIGALGLAAALMAAKIGFRQEQAARVLVRVRSTQGRRQPWVPRDRDENS